MSRPIRRFASFVRPGRSRDDAEGYDAFVSYSHAADGKLAPSLQRGLRGFAKPWYRLNALRVFRDQTSLSATPALWSGIERALARSRFFILLASPEAAASPWVDKEVSYWLEHKPRDTLLIALTEGEIAWDERTGRVDRARTTALPRSLAETFASEPFWIDLRFARAQSDVSLRQPDFRNAVADLAAPIHGRDKDTLLGEDITQHRRALRLARAAVATLVALLIAASVSAFLAVKQLNAARVGQSNALAGEAVAILDTDPVAALRLASRSAETSPTSAAEDALRITLARFPPLVLSGHYKGVTGAAFSPDGKLVLTTGGDRTARIWDATSGRNLDTVEIDGADDNFGGFASFSPDGKLVVTTGWSDTAQIWGVADHGKLRHTLVTDEFGFDTRVAAFSPDSKLVVTANMGTVLIWEAASGRVRRTLVKSYGSGQDVYGASFRPDGKLLVTAGEQAVRLWDVASGRSLRRLKGHRGPVRSAVFSPDGKLVVTAGDDKTARVWDVASGRSLHTLRGHTGRVLSALFSPDGKLVVTAGDGTARVWDVASGRSLRTLTRSTDVYYAEFSPDGRLVVTADGGDTTQIWDVASGDGVLTVPGSRAGLSPDGKRVVTLGNDDLARVWDIGSDIPRSTRRGQVAAFSPDGSLVVSAAGRTARVSDVRSGRSLRTLTGHTGGIRSIAFTSDGKVVVTAGDDKTAHVWDVASGRSLRTLTGHTGSIRSAAFSSDGKLVVTMGDDKTARVWDVASGRSLRTFRSDIGPVSAALSPDGKLVVTADGDESARVWEVASGRLRQKLKGKSPAPPGVASITSAAFSPDGKHVVTADWGGVAQIWDVASGRSLRLLTGHTCVEMDEARLCWIVSEAFSPDGKLVVTAGIDGTARIWDVASGRSLHTLTGHTNDLDSAAFSPDGKLVVTVGEDGTARLWDVAYGRLLHTLDGVASGYSSVAAVSPDDRLALTAGGSSVRIWTSCNGCGVPLDQLLARAKEQLALRG